MSTTLGVVSTRAGNLNVRRAPSMGAAIVGTLRKGSAVEIRATSGDWHRVRTGRTTGWVSAPYVLVQDDSFQRRPLMPVSADFETWPESHKALAERALSMLGDDVSAFDALPEDLQRECWGWQFREDPGHPHHKDVVCADLVYACLKTAGARLAWTVDRPTGTEHSGKHAANYFRPGGLLVEPPPAAKWLPGDIIVYWDGELEYERLRHVNLYVGPFAGMGLDGRLYSRDDPPDVVSASVDYLDRRSKECGTEIRGVSKDRCLQNRFGYEHVRRLRHVDLDTASAAPPEVRTAPAAPAAPAADEDPFRVGAGQLTFDAEGLERRGPFFSRVPHVPSTSSGVTIGRGYDLGSRNAAEVIATLEAAGVPADVARRFAQGAGLRGGAARDFVREHLDGVEITPAQQKALFEATYREMEREVIRICGKGDVVERYGATDWQALDARIRDVLVDLRYRGDYTPGSRRRIQPLVTGNDVGGFAEALADRTYWHHGLGVPLDRFERRAAFLQA